MEDGMSTSPDGLAYLRQGQGPLLLVMHGGLGMDHHYLRPWLDPLAARAELVYYDHRGNGASAEPDDWSAVDIGSWADDAEGLRQHLGREKMVLLGHSYGGFIALEYALRYPDRLTGLMLCGAGPNLHHVELAMANAAARGTPEQMATLEVALGQPSPDDAAAAAAWRGILSLYFERPHPEFEEAFFRTTRFRHRAQNRSLIDCLPGFDVSDRLGEIRVPTLILQGAGDWILPPEPCSTLLGAIPGSRTVIFERSGHLPFVEEPDRFLAVVQDWLAELN